MDPYFIISLCIALILHVFIDKKNSKIKNNFKT